MIRPLPIAFPGAMDHTTSRGHARAAIDADAAERAALLSLFPGGTSRPWSTQGELFWPYQHGEGCPDYRTMGLWSQQQRQFTAMAQLPNGEQG